MRAGRIRFAAVAAIVAAAGLVAATAPTTLARPAGAQADPAAKLSPALATIADTVGIQETGELSALVGLPADGAGSLLEADGGFLVYVQMAPVTPEGIAGLEAAGATIVHVSERYQVVTVAMTPGTVLPAAEVPTVARMTQALEPLVDRSPAAARAQEVGIEAAACPTGVVSEADTQLKAALARTNFGVDGTGVKIGVLSDSYAKVTSPVSAANDVAAGELPGSSNPCGYPTPVTVVHEYNGASIVRDEGRAMIQAIHDLAPGATFAFSTAFDGEFAFADYIEELHTVQQVDIIVDDVVYFDEPFFQDGPVAVAVDEAVAAGTTYFSSAGNSNRTLGANNISSYEAPAFRSATCPTSVTTQSGYASATCHDFDTTGAVDVGWDFSYGSGGGTLNMTFQWSEPWYGVSTDIALCYLDQSNTLIGCVNLTDPSDDVPFELLQASLGVAANRRVVVVRKAGAGTPRFKFLLTGSTNLSSVQYAAASAPDITDGSSIFGHAAAGGAVAVAAVPYDNANTPESFTSRGNVTHYWNPVVDTNPAAALGAAEVIAKPQVAATDGARNSFFGQNVSGVWRFYGTSQAAPHAAAVGALMLDFVPGLTPAAVGTALGDTAVAVSNGGTAVAVGDGLIDANAALDALPPGIVKLSPGGGPVGTSVVIAGGNFVNPSTVSFNGTAATSVTVHSDKRITAVVPVGATTGPVTVTNVNGTGTSPVSFFVGNPASGRFNGITPVRALDTRITGPCVGTTPRNLNIGGVVANVPATATAVALNVTVVEPSASAYLTVWPRGAAQPLASNLNFVPGQIVPNMVTVKLGQSGGISIYADAGCPHVVVDVAGYYSGSNANPQVGPGGFQGITPVRALDTRNTGPCVGTSPRSLTLAGQFGIPTNASAVALNVTVVTPSLPGFLTVWPAGGVQPPTSNLNFVPGQIVPNMVTVGLGSGGAVQMASDKGCPHVVVDIAGYFEGGGAAGPGGFTAITPARALDTRISGSGPCLGAIRTLDLTPSPLGGSPAAAALNVTVVTPTLPGFLTVFPADEQTPPWTSNLNFVPGQIVPNMVTVKLAASPAGAIKLYADKGCPHVVVDATGYYSAP